MSDLNGAKPRALPVVPATALRIPLSSAPQSEVQDQHLMPVLRLGFRPFFLLSSLFAVLSMLVWLWHLTGMGPLPTGVPPMSWHGHEMLFGFTVAVIAGFLLTAVRNWTSVPTPTGLPLLGLALVWLLGRLGMMFGQWLPRELVAGLDLAFLPLLTLSLAIPLWKSRNRRNYAFVPLLLGLTVANAAFHFGESLLAAKALRLALSVIVLIVLVVGGRVIPVFTRNAIPGLKIEPVPWRDWLALGTAGLVLVGEGMGVTGGLAAALAFGCALAQALRMSGWGSLKTLSKPIVWVLHVGYGFLPLGYGLKGIGHLWEGVPANTAMHVLTVGVVGVLTLGMMSRVSLGHTGRLLEVRRAVAAAFGLLSGAALVRGVAPLLLPEAYQIWLVVSGLLWAVAFLLFAWVYAPILTQPRADGKAG